MEEKNEIYYDVEEEMHCGVAKAIPLKKVFELMKSIFKIEYYLDNKKYVGTGFFMELLDIGKNVLVTNHHIITQRVIDEQIEISLILENDKEIRIKLDKNKRLIKCFNRPIDATIIEILDSDNIKNDVLFLFNDLNIFNGYEQYKGEDIIILQHPLGKDIHCGIGKIIDYNNFEFHHSADTDFGSSGSPIILFKNFFVVGIHKGADKKSKYNIGTFIHIIIEKIKNTDDIQNYSPLFSQYETDISNDKNKNQIINDNNQEQIKKDNNDINKRNNNELILVYKKVFGKFNLFGSPFVDVNKNNCKLIINGKETELCTVFEDHKPNNNILEVKFIQTKKITNLCYMFSVSYILEIKNILYLSSKYITSMNHMFHRCEYLTSLPEEFSDFDTSNVTNMDNMFGLCTQLEKLPNISKWNTINVKDMRQMFDKCYLLKAAPDISKWNIKNVKNISWIFSECTSLESIPNISQIQFPDGCETRFMFYGCSEKFDIPYKYKNKV